LYKRLLSGHGVDVCEQRLRGSLNVLDEEGFAIKHSIVVKRISPPHWFFLQVRGTKNTPFEDAFPAAQPKGKLRYIRYSTGRDISVADFDRIYTWLQRIIERQRQEDYQPRGSTVKLQRGVVYIDAHTTKYLMNYAKNQTFWKLLKRELFRG
jgi:hypothetical protein